MRTGLVRETTSANAIIGYVFSGMGGVMVLGGLYSMVSFGVDAQTFIFLLIPGIFLVTGLVLVIERLRRTRRRKRIIENGVPLIGTVYDIVENTTNRINGMIPLKIVVEAKSPKTGEQLFAMSNDYLVDVGLLVAKGAGVQVYFDEKSNSIEFPPLRLYGNRRYTGLVVKQSDPNENNQ